MTADNVEFDFQKALKGIQEGKPFTGKDGVLTSLIKNLAEAALEAELDSHLAQEVTRNRRNGKTKKTIKSLDLLSTPSFSKMRVIFHHGQGVKKTSGLTSRALRYSRCTAFKGLASCL